jgi:hypothetical protein
MISGSVYASGPWTKAMPPVHEGAGELTGAKNAFCEPTFSTMNVEAGWHDSLAVGGAPSIVA